MVCTDRPVPDEIRRIPDHWAGKWKCPKAVKCWARNAGAANTGNWDAVVQQVQWCMAIHTPVTSHCELEYPIRDIEPVNNITVSQKKETLYSCPYLCVGSEMINWIAINTIGTYCLSKSHTLYITSSSLQHVLKMPSSTNASGGRWHHSPTARPVTTLPRAAHSLLMHHFSSSMNRVKMNMTYVK